MRIPVALAALALTLTACGGTTASGGSPTETASAAASASATSAAGSFASPLTVATGVTVTVGAPKSFKPGAFASNFVPGQVADMFDVTVDNKSAKPVDMTTVLISGTSGANICNDILDGDNGLNGAPTDPLAAGASISFKFGIACDGKVGDPLALTVQVDNGTANLTGKLA